MQVLLSLDTEWFQRLALSRLTYGRELEQVGLEPVLVDYGEVYPENGADDLAQSLLAGKSGLLLTGGGDVNPSLYGEPTQQSKGVATQRDRLELALLNAALDKKMPVMGICRGVQLINVACGGTLRNIREQKDLRRNHKAVLRGHSVSIEPASLLAEIIGVTKLSRVTSNHGQAIDEVGCGLRICARAADGVIEAIESSQTDKQYSVMGFQWHPEFWSNKYQERVFERFASAVQEHTRAHQASG